MSKIETKNGFSNADFKNYNDYITSPLYPFSSTSFIAQLINIRNQLYQIGIVHYVHSHISGNEYVHELDNLIVEFDKMVIKLKASELRK